MEGFRGVADAALGLRREKEPGFNFRQYSLYQFQHRRHLSDLQCVWISRVAGAPSEIGEGVRFEGNRPEGDIDGRTRSADLFEVVGPPEGLLMPNQERF